MALEQAARDFLLSLQKSIEAVLRETLLRDRRRGAHAGRHGRRCWCVSPTPTRAHDMNESRVDVLLSPEDREAVGAIVMEKYRELVGQGLDPARGRAARQGLQGVVRRRQAVPRLQPAGRSPKRWRRSSSPRSATSSGGPRRSRAEWSTSTWWRACRARAARGASPASPPDCCSRRPRGVLRAGPLGGPRGDRRGPAAGRRARLGCGRSVDAETQLRNALARIRAARAGAAYAARAHPPRRIRHALRGRGRAGHGSSTTRSSASSLLDRHRWALLDETGGRCRAFGVQAVFAYAFKLRLVEKWAALRRGRRPRIAAAQVVERNLARSSVVSARTRQRHGRQRQHGHRRVRRAVQPERGRLRRCTATSGSWPRSSACAAATPTCRSSRAPPASRSATRSSSPASCSPWSSGPGCWRRCSTACRTRSTSSPSSTASSCRAASRSEALPRDQRVGVHAARRRRRPGAGRRHARAWSPRASSSTASWCRSRLVGTAEVVEIAGRRRVHRHRPHRRAGRTPAASASTWP